MVLFESAVIGEYLEDTKTDTPLHPADPLQRARYPGWMEVGSSILGDLWGFRNGEGCRDLRDETQGTDRKIRVCREGAGRRSVLAGEMFSLVDAVFAPIFRYFDTFDLMTPTGVFDGLPKVARWRAGLAARPSG